LENATGALLVGVLLKIFSISRQNVAKRSKATSERRNDKTSRKIRASRYSMARLMILIDFAARIVSLLVH
jgi:hypothetical protein